MSWLVTHRVGQEGLGVALSKLMGYSDAGFHGDHEEGRPAPVPKTGWVRLERGDETGRGGPVATRGEIQFNRRQHLTGTRPLWRASFSKVGRRLKKKGGWWKKERRGGGGHRGLSPLAELRGGGGSRGKKREV